ncbi:MAG: pyridoxal phosphate-dependent aminotransferase [Saprospiraceae bacterium]|nr:pyridoxal phosphate-dependent aminotransferase [Saprospiraceae bacterium]
MAKKSREMRSQGIDVISFSLGEPDFDTPQFIKDSAIQAIEDGYTYYPPVNGYGDLRETICEKFMRDNNLHFEPEQIVVSTGGKQSIANVIFALVEDGDEVVLPAPFWVTYPEQVNLAGGKVVPIYTSVETDYKMTAEQLDAALTQDTKLLVYSSPCNPSGSVYSRDELEAFAKVIEKYPNLVVVSDEMYEHILFEGSRASLAEFPAIREQVVILNGLSKGFAMTGWRLGYVAAPLWLAKACAKFQGQITSGANAMTQRAAITAIAADPNRPEVQDMVSTFKKRRDLILTLMKDIPGMKSHKPTGAFYVLPDISYYFGKSNGGTTINNASDFAEYLLLKAHVALVSGEPFGVPNCVRISYANSDEQIKEGLKRIKAALAELS